MFSYVKNQLMTLLRRSERYTRTDMVYLFASGWWTNIGTLTITFCSLALYILFANFLPKEVYGTYQYFLSLAAIISALTLTGMNGAVTRAVARGFDGALKEAVRAQLRWSIIPASCALLVGAYYFFNGNTIFGLGMLGIAIFTPLNSTFSLYASFLQGKQDFRRGFLYGMGWNLPYYGALALATIITPSALALLAANLISQCAALFFFYRKTITTHVSNNVTDPETVPYGKHMSIMNVLNMTASQADTVLAFQFLGPAELAIYSFATAIPERFGGFFKFIQTAALPKLSRKSPEEVSSAFGPRVLYAVAATGMAALVYAAAAPFIFSTLFPTYIEAVPFTQLYALSIVASLAGLFTTGLTAGRRIQELYIVSAVSPIVQCALQFLGVLFFGLWGLVIGRTLSQFISAGLSFFLLLRSAERIT